MNKNSCSVSDRKGSTGGQAVVEGVMMKSKDRWALAVRKENGEIAVQSQKYTTICQRTFWGKVPVARGVINFIETLKLSMDTLTRSTEMLGIEEEPTKFEKWLEKKFGKSLLAVVGAVGMILGVFLSLALFVFLPTLIADFLHPLLDMEKGTYGSDLVYSLIKGVVRIAIFLAYIFLISLWKEMHRVFQYHGAEHMSIFAHENYEELTVENVRKYRRFHPRCGTSFMVIMMLVGILVMSFVPWSRITESSLVRSLISLIFLPLIVGVGYEFIKFAGKHDTNIVVKILSAPGLWVQRITTKDPDDSMLEVAIASLKASLPDVYPPENPSENKLKEDGE